MGTALAAVAVLSSCSPPAEEASPAPALSVARSLGDADTAGYLRALEPRPFDFPADHGPHPGFRTEWWYFTGNLQEMGREAGPAGGDGDGEEPRRFGFQLTFFRSQLAPPAPDGAPAGAPERASDLAASEVYMGHFAVTDIETERFYAFERFARAAGGLAGARAPGEQAGGEAVPDTVRVWLDGWEMESLPSPEGGAPNGGPGQDGLFPLMLRAAEGPVSLQLRLGAGGPLVLQGEDGLSQKGPEPGNASYYYTYPRIPASGEIRTEDGTFRVEGTAWLDREWSTSVLAERQVGWDWFALQLADGRTLMVYQLRQRDGTPDPLSSGSLTAVDGSRTALGVDDFELEPLGSWTSPASGVTYPSGWRLRVPEAGLDLVVEPWIPNQELDLTFRYWEGAVRVVDASEDSSGESSEELRGVGYVELTGYDEALASD